MTKMKFEMLIIKILHRSCRIMIEISRKLFSFELPLEYSMLIIKRSVVVY